MTNSAGDNRSAVSGGAGPAPSGDTEPTASVDTRTGTKPYVPWLSWARVVAIVAIVTIHVFGHLVLAWGEVPADEWHVANVLDAAARFGVPLFVIVSGAALLPRSALLSGSPAESLRSFYLRRASRIAIPLVVWTAFFLWFDRWSNDQPVSIYTFVQGYLWGRPYYHLYFLYVIAGLYLITPFLRIFVAHASHRLVLFAAVLCLALAMLDKGQHLWMGGAGGFNAFTYFVPWIGYYLLGHVLFQSLQTATFSTKMDGTGGTTSARGVGCGLSVGVAVGLWVGSVVVTAAATWLLFPVLGAGAISLTYDYFFPTTLVATITATILLAKVSARLQRPATEETNDTKATNSTDRRGPLVRRLADLTLGVFLLHPIPLELLRKWGPTFNDPWLDLGYHALTVVGLLVGCALVTYGLLRIPVLRRLV